LGGSAPVDRQSSVAGGFDGVAKATEPIAKADEIDTRLIVCGQLNQDRRAVPC
jgi:hypothetical protein